MCRPPQPALSVLPLTCHTHRGGMARAQSIYKLRCWLPSNWLQPQAAPPGPARNTWKAHRDDGAVHAADLALGGAVLPASAAPAASASLSRSW